MITNVEIRNFKSVRSLSFEPKRVTLFIGEPNTGKTNIIEALALLSEGVHAPAVFQEVFRIRSVVDLFTDQQVANPISVITSGPRCALSFKGPEFKFVASPFDDRSIAPRIVVISQTGQPSEAIQLPWGIGYYRFKSSASTSSPAYGVLQPPFAENLTAVLYSNRGLRRRVTDLFRTRNFSLEIRPVEMELRITKTVEEELYSFPYESISETWRRLVFYMAVLETNQNATILLDEPEANTFPFYTSYLAERIALDASNQFILTTHNPYVLSSIVSKTPAKDVAVFVAGMEGFHTTLKPVPMTGLARILDYGPEAFLNLDKLVEA